MDIYNLNNKLSEESEMLKVLGIENVGFRFTMEGDEYASCTCGCFSRINKKYGREKILDYTRIRTDNGLVAKCKKCGNPYFYDINYNEEDESIPIKFQPTVVLNSSEYFVIRVEVYTVKSILNELEFNNEDEFYIVYDRINDDLFVAEESCNGVIDVTVDGYSCSLQRCKLSDALSWNDCYYDIGFEPYFYSLVGFKEISDLVREAAGITMNTDEVFVGISYVLGELALNIKIKYLPEIQKEINNGKPLRKFLMSRLFGIDEINTLISKLEECRIDYTKSSIQEAFGVDVDFLSTCDGYEGYKKTSLFNKLVIKENLQEYVTENAECLSDNAKLKIADLYKIASSANKVDCFETFLKHIIRAVNNGMETEHVIASLERIVINIEQYADIIDFSKPFSKAILTKKSFIDNNILTLDEYNKFLQKPTINTIYRLLQQH